MLKHKATIRVRYADTDKMQFVYNGKFLEYFEVGRTELLRSVGLPYSELENAGYQLPLLEAGIKYHKYATYDDLLDIEATISKVNSPKLHIDYRITKTNEEELIAEGFTDHVFIKVDTKKATRPPKLYTEALAPYFKK